jgi:hypothetical protein
VRPIVLPERSNALSFAEAGPTMLVQGAALSAALLPARQWRRTSQKEASLMNYPLLRAGDHLPAVGVLQKLLNLYGAKLSIDGDFGLHTKLAVERFQRDHKLFVDGVVGKQTWPRLAEDTNLPILDCIDVCDPDLYQMELQDIRLVGGNPVVIGGMCNGVGQAVQDICAAAGSGKVFLLRFHGHGSPGTAIISGGQNIPDPGELASIAPENLKQLRSVLRRLRGVFGPYGCIQFMHCSTGRGRNGRALLNMIAQEVGVPSTAAVFDQLGGQTTTFRFEGPTHTVVPSGGTIRSWCQSLPELTGQCVPAVYRVGA